MRIKNLSIKNIGPFKEANLDFTKGNIEHPPVTIITGENGTGKTVLLDAIRGVLSGPLEELERNIIRDLNDFSISSLIHISSSLKYNLYYSDENDPLVTTYFDKNRALHSPDWDMSQVYENKPNNGLRYWITNYWTSRSATDSFEIKNLSAPKPEYFFKDSLNGIQPNVEVTQLICFFDYLRSSNSPKEKERGEYLYEILKKIIKLSLIDGEFKYVERSTLTPIIHQTGKDISLDKLSSGNLYLIQRLVSLLGQMYSVHILNNTKVEEICNVPGLLMIDEAENHLHPKWQKIFINSILDIFPNLQIIATTHSPFIVSSVENANVFVCKSMKDHSIVEDHTSEYSNMPIEEVLLSPAFDTGVFNETISKLLKQRKTAIDNNNNEEAEAIKEKLKLANPSYFSYFDIDNMLAEISQ